MNSALERRRNCIGGRGYEKGKGAVLTGRGGTELKEPDYPYVNIQVQPDHTAINQPSIHQAIKPQFDPEESFSPKPSSPGSGTSGPILSFGTYLNPPHPAPITPLTGFP